MDRGDRKVSKRMERIIEASSSHLHIKSEQQVSLKCVDPKGGSTRKIHIANPLYRNHSGNLPPIQ